MRALTRLASISLVTLAVSALALPAAAGTDDFVGNVLGRHWSVVSPDEAEYAVDDGWLRVDVPGRHWLGLPGMGGARAPLLLLEPDSDAGTIIFETRLRFSDGPEAAEHAAAGLVLARRDLDAAVLFRAVRSEQQVQGEWWSTSINTAIGGSGPPAFIGGEDIWLRFEHRGDGFAFSRKQREDDPWEDVTAGMNGNLSNIANQFPAGTFLAGLFVTSGLAHDDDDVEVGFDYFASPDIPTLDVDAAGKVAVAWAGLKQASSIAPVR